MTASYTPLYDHTTTGSNTKFVVANILYRLLLKIPSYASGAQCRGVYSGLHLKPSGYREPSDTYIKNSNQYHEVVSALYHNLPIIYGEFHHVERYVLNSNSFLEYASHSSSSKSSRPGVIVGGVLGAVFGLMVVVLCIFYIRRRTRRPRSVRHDSTVESRTMSQPLSLPLSLPPPVPPKGIPVNITPDPFMLKYSEAHQDPREPLRSDISSSTEQPRGSSSQPDAHDNTSISELMGRLRTLEAQFAVDKLYRMRNPTPSPPNYMEEAQLQGIRRRNSSLFKLYYNIITGHGSYWGKYIPETVTGCHRFFFLHTCVVQHCPVDTYFADEIWDPVT
ncbi:hypothetical protein C8R42DRAFT_643457 [Lentinula raphanica]|nr:hypothetical protein C8R42DRAFT_643457 [Lentinula raphanica]